MKAKKYNQFLLAALSLASINSASAQTVRYWDPSSGGSFGGITGTDYWTPNAANLWTGSSTGNTSRVNLLTTGTSDAATFGGTAALGGGTLPVGSVTAASLSYLFSTTGSVVLSGGVINLAATTTITASNGTNTDTISASISGAATSLTKAGTTTVVLSGYNTYTGSTIISAGILTLSNSLALQNSALNASTSITGDGTNGLKTTVTSLTIGGLSGTKDFSTLFTTTSGGFTGLTALTLNPGNAAINTYSGVIADGAVEMTLTKSGLGTQVLSGTNTYTGATTVSAGNLTLDYTTESSRLDNIAPLILGSGTITLSGGTTYVETVGSTTLSGAAALTQSSGTAKLALGAISGIGSIDFGADNIATTVNANDASGILGGFATVGGSNWAKNDGLGNIVAYTSGYTDIDALGSTIVDGASTNVKILNDGISGNIELSATTATINTLLQANATTAATVNTVGKTLALNGVMIGSSAEALTLGAAAGNGTLIPAISGGNLSLHNFNAAKTLTINAAIANNTTASALTKTGAGTLVLAAANTYTGATTIGGGTLSLTGSLTDSNVTVSGNAVLSESSTGSIAGAVEVNHSSNGTSTLAGANSYTGVTTISSGILNIQNGSALGTIAAGTSVASESALQIQGGITIGDEALSLTGTGVSNTGALRSISGNNIWGGAITLNSGVRIAADADSLTLDVASGNAITSTNQALLVSGAGNVTVADPIAIGTGALQKEGAGTLTLTGNNTIGGVAISTGAVNIQHANGLGSGTLRAVIGSGGALQLQGGITVAKTIFIGSTGVSSNGGIRNISGDNTISSVITFVASSRFNSDAGTLIISNSMASNGVAFTSPTMSFGGDGNILVSGSITPNQASLVKDGTGTLTLTNAANTYGSTANGTTTITAGTLTIGGAGRLNNGAYARNISNAGTFNFSSSAAQIFSGVISGAGTFNCNGSGTLTLTGANTFNGATVVNGGTLKLDFSAATAPTTNIIGTSSALTLGGGTLNLTGKASTVNSQTVNGTTLNAGASTIVLAANATANPLLLTLGSITRNTGATVDFIQPTGTIDATNGFTTTTANTAGSILGSWATVGGSDWATNNGTNIVALGFYTLTSVAGTTAANYTGSNIDVDNSAGLIDGAATPNSLRFNNAGAHTVTLAAGDTAISSGGILVTSAVGNNLSTITGGTLQGAASDYLSVIQNNASNGLTIESIIADNGGATGLIKSGPGALTLTGANLYTGGTIINSGTLQIGSSGSLGSGASYAGAIANTGTLLYSSSANQTLSGIISGSGGLIKDTSSVSTLTLSGPNTYKGNTTVSAGVLNITGSITGDSLSSKLNIAPASSTAVVNYNGGISTLQSVTGANVVGTSSVLNMTAGTLTISPGVTTGTQSVSGSGHTGTGAYGFYNITGGTFRDTNRFTMTGKGTASPTIGPASDIQTAVVYVSGTGIIDQTGSEWWLNYSLGQITVADSGKIDRTGSTNPFGIFMDHTSGVTGGGYGVLNLAGANAQVLLGTAPIRFGNSATAGLGDGQSGFVNVAAGTLSVGANVTTSLNANPSVINNAYFNFAGGTVKASANVTGWIPVSNNSINFNANLFGPIDNSAVSGAPANFTGGLTVDSDTFNFAIANPLQASGGSGVTQANLSVSGGSGYVGAPAVIFSDTDVLPGGSPAAGYALISGGVVTGIIITSPGTYLTGTIPTVTLIGGGGAGASVSSTALNTANTGGGLTKVGAGILTLSGANTYSGNTTVSGGTLALADNAQLKFVLGATSGVNNNITGAGTVTLDGDFVIDTTAADALASGNWTIENVPSLSGAYGASFTVVGFTDAGSDKWTKVNGAKTYTFDETTGTLTLATAVGYSSWASFNGATADRSADHDNDGVSNGIEFFIGGPSGDTTGFTALPPIVKELDGTYSVTWTKASTYTGTYGTDYVVETSSTLTGVWAVEASPGTVAVNATTVKFTFPGGPAYSGKNFARLKVTGP